MIILNVDSNAGYVLDQSISCLVYKMSERCVSKRPKWRLQMFCFCPKPKDAQFTIIK